MLPDNSLCVYFLRDSSLVDSSEHQLMVTRSLQDPNILPIYAEIVSGQPAVSKTSSGIIVTPRSRPSSGLSPLPLNAKPIQKISSSPSGPGSPLFEGRYSIKHTRFFPSWIWRERWLTVSPQSIAVHRGNTKAGNCSTLDCSMPLPILMQKSPTSKHIHLFNLTRVEPDADKEGCLVVEYTSAQHSPRSAAAIASNGTSKSDTLSIYFKSYDELYTWRDALYDRSQLSAPIGNPTGFKHNTHVGFDPLSGAFVVGFINCYEVGFNVSCFCVYLGLTDTMAIRQPARTDC